MPAGLGLSRVEVHPQHPGRRDASPFVRLRLEEQELVVLQEFLPAQLSPEELAELVAGAIAASGAQSMCDMGAVMKWLMPKLEGRADGSSVSRLVKERLAAASG